MTDWREDDGYVTVAVVGVTALMAALVVGLLMMFRPTAVLTRLDVEQLRQESRIEAGLNAAAFLLFFAGDRPSTLDGRQLVVGGSAVSLAVSPEKGRIDLNTSSPDLLRRLFAAAKGTSMSPDAFAARVQDWRDEDDEKTIEGAESFEYAAVPGGVRPANAPFRSVGDLRFLFGLSSQDRERIEPFLTTYNRDGLVDPKEAVGLVRLALGEESLADDAERVSPFAEPATAKGDGNTSIETVPEAFRVLVLTHGAGGDSVRGAEAIIAPPVDDRESYSILEWRRVSRPASVGGASGAGAS